MPTALQYIPRHVLGYCALLLLMSCIVLPGIATLPPMDRDEARFAQASRQMLESGDFVTVRFQNELRAKKPAGIYWLQAMSAAIFGKDSITAYRLPSFLGGLGIVWLVFFFARRLMSPTAAMLAAVCMATSLLLATEARLAKTDAMLTCLIVIQQYALWMIYRTSRQARYVSGWYAMLLWVACGLGILIKGPVAPAILLLTLLTLVLVHRQWLAGLRPWLGLVIVSGLVLPWLLLVSAETEGVFLETAIRQDFISKLLAAQESHFAPPGSHFVLLLAVFWPGSLLLGRTLPRIWQARNADWVRFMLAWIIPFWLVLEIIPTKLPHYTLPVLPAVAMLVAHFTLLPMQPGKSKAGGLGNRIGRRLTTVWEYAALGVGGCIGMLFFFAIIIDWADLTRGRGLLEAIELTNLIDRRIGLWLVAMLFVGAAMGYGWRWHKTGESYPIFAMLVAGAIFHSITLGGLLPRLDDLHLSARVEAAISKIGLTDRPVAAAGYHEPSLVFLLGGDVLLFSPSDTALFLAEGTDGVAVVANSVRREFINTANAVGVRLAGRASIRGFNYSRGQPTRLIIYTVAE